MYIHFIFYFFNITDNQDVIPFRIKIWSSFILI